MCCSLFHNAFHTKYLACSIPSCLNNICSLADAPIHFSILSFNMVAFWTAKRAALTIVFLLSLSLTIVHKLSYELPLLDKIAYVEYR